MWSNEGDAHKKDTNQHFQPGEVDTNVEKSAHLKSYPALSSLLKESENILGGTMLC